jgi:hypothetical protein
VNLVVGLLAERNANSGLIVVSSELFSEFGMMFPKERNANSGLIVMSSELLVYSA